MKNKKTLYTILSVLILLFLAGWAYWYFLIGPVTAPQQTSTNTPTGFQPIDRTNPSGQGNSSTSTNSQTTSGQINPNSTLTALRLLSSTPIGGYGASTTASTTVVRWVDRGRGNIYQASYNTPVITTISNTVVPRIYESSWDKNLTAFIGTLFQDNNSSPLTVYAQITAEKPSATSSASTTDTFSGQSPTTPFSLHGMKLPNNVTSYAVSPKKDKMVMLTSDGANSTAYITNLNGTGVNQLFVTPLTQINLNWPSDNVITVTTNGSANYSGFLYFVNPKTGKWTKILGLIHGLSVSVSHDGKNVLWSGIGDDSNLVTKLYSVDKGISIDAGIITLADKCTWGNSYKEMVYCAVPTTLTSGIYPDDWYIGKVSSSDDFWQINDSTGVVERIYSSTNQPIDGFNLGLDPKDDFLFFMNKKDLSFWSLDLSSVQN